MEVIAKTDEYPLWRIAAAKVLETFETRGYGATFYHNQLKQWMGIDEPTSFQEAEQARLDYLSGMEKLREDLLKNSNLHLHPVVGKGYAILHPKDQVTIGADRYIRKSRQALKTSAQILQHVNTGALDMESQNVRFNKIGRLAFLESSFRKRKIPFTSAPKRIA